MDITSLLQGPMGQQIVNGVVKQLGINEGQAQTAISAAVPFIVSALSKNANSGDAPNILNALTNKHDGSLLDNLGGFLNGGDFSDGTGILGHILGGKQANVENAIGKSSGLNSGQIGQILAMLAPIIMGYLGKQNSTNKLDAGGLTDLLGGMLGGVSQNNQAEMGTIGKILDQDNDGSVMDDVMDLGGKLLGGFFGKK